MPATDITVGVDVGTSSVKAVAARADGAIVATARIPHEFRIPGPQRLEHDAAVWGSGPLAAIEALGIDRAAGVSVAAMVPSLTAVDGAGVPIAPGLLYGDERGHTGSAGNPAESGELAAFLRWLASEQPAAAGFWPAQAVANHALGGVGAISTTVASTAYPLFDWTGWSAEALAGTGATVEQLPPIVPSMQPAGEVARLGGAVLEGGTIDAMGEQLVAGADTDGDVLVICGTTLIVWIVTPEAVTVDGYYSVPHTVAGKWLLGGPSNAGGLFLDWVRRMLDGGGAPPDAQPDPQPEAQPVGHAVPLWVPYPRGERVPLADPGRRAELHGLDLTHGPAAVRRAAYEAAGFVVRRMIDSWGGRAGRVIAVGGGVRVPEWMQALADCTQLPVAVSGVPEGGALGAAFLARVAAGLETGTAESGRWARTDRIVDPDLASTRACEERYARWRELAA
jgi:xylulokinase